MNRRLLCLAILAAPLSAAGQESFGTLAVGAGLGYGAAVDYPTQAEADTAALNECRTRDEGCEIVERFGEGMCFAIAVSEPADVLGWAVAPDPQQARTGAHQHCIDGGGGRACRVTDSDCNGNSADLATATPVAPAATPTPTVVRYGAPCERSYTQRRDCWVEVPGQSGCYAWFGRTNTSIFPPYNGSRFDLAIWEGQCLNGLAHGHWVVTWQPYGEAMISQGSFVEGKREGYWDARREYDEREANFVNGRVHGEVVIHRNHSNETVRIPVVHGQRAD